MSRPAPEGFKSPLAAKFLAGHGILFTGRYLFPATLTGKTASGATLAAYPKYATTVIGAHSVPDWYEALDRLVAVGQLSMTSMADAQFRASQAAILDQEIAGIDVITGGEMHRRTHNRHAPPNAMLNHFWQKIPAFQGSTKPKPITPHDPNVFHPGGDLPERASRTTSISVWSMSSRRSRR